MRVTPWGRLVLISALLVVGGTIALVASDLASREEVVFTYPVSGSLEGVAFDVGDADVAVVGGGPGEAVEVERRERSSFGHVAETTRTVGEGIFRVRSRCPDALPDTCSVAYRIVVPDNVPVEIRTDGGAVRFNQYRGSARVVSRAGDIAVEGFCGFSLTARADSGDVRAAASCAPQQLALRSNTGAVHAVVPAGRYRVDAQSASGRQLVRGIDSTPDAPFTIQALSSSGDVTVEQGAS